MKLYEIINPSDAYTMEAEEFRLTAAAVLLLGEGHWGLKGITDETEEVPVFLFGGHEPWLEAQGLSPIGDFVEEHAAEIAKVLDSVLIGDADERRAFQRAMDAVKDPEDRAAAWAEWHDEKRSSLNDIGSHAKSLASALRARPA